MCEVIHDRNVLYSLYVVQNVFVDRLYKVQGPTECHGQCSPAQVDPLIVSDHHTRDLMSIHGDVTRTCRFPCRTIQPRIVRCVGDENIVLLPSGERTSIRVVDEGNSLNARKVNVFHTDLLPLKVKWSCNCAGKEMWFTQDECVMRNPACCFAEQVCVCVCVCSCGCSSVAEVQLSIT